MTRGGGGAAGGASMAHLLVGLVVVLAAMAQMAHGGGHDYGTALSKSILYFEAQRSGVLPASQRIAWRGNSGLHDGKANGVDLVGVYYDAGDNVKFGLPMAFTVTMMAWSVLEYGQQMAAAGELGNAMEAVKWGTEPLTTSSRRTRGPTCSTERSVGDGDSDHSCWERPEDMTTSRQAYCLDPEHPGSELAGETAAAMAAASLVFRRSNPGYANQLLQHSLCRCLFEFADKYRGRYDYSISVAKNYYGSVSGYGVTDHHIWCISFRMSYCGRPHVYQATDNRRYLDYLANNAEALGGTGWSINQFGWDIKYPGVQILAAKFLLQGKAGEHAAVLQRYRQLADFFACSCIGKGSVNVERSRGGMMYHQTWNNIQFVTSASFLLAAYSDHLAAAGNGAVQCPAGTAAPSELLAFTKSQVDYILGSNPMGISYMVGYGARYPQRAHHRGASIVSIKASPSPVSCRGGYSSCHFKIVSYSAFFCACTDFQKSTDQTIAYLHGEFTIKFMHLCLHAEITATSIKNQTSLPPLSPAADHHQHASPVVEIEQNATRSWTQDGRTYHRYSVTVTNRSPDKTVEELHIGIAKLYGPVWGVDRSRYGYVFPSWLPSLPAGKSAVFVYIHAAPPANVWVTGYKL
ncbi:hypothetical protein ABZP36_017209, partial [Zizania latifolia]